MEIFLYLPQKNRSFDHLVMAAKLAEKVGFTGMAGMDHMNLPGGPASAMKDKWVGGGGITSPENLTAASRQSSSIHEAMMTNAWIAAHTDRVKVGSLVLCDSFRHPATLAKEAVSLDHASRGRFELGIGWGSWNPEFEIFGLPARTPAERVARLEETLDVVRALWAGEEVTYRGKYHQLRSAFIEPRPIAAIPIVIGGSGKKIRPIIRKHADWCNVDSRHVANIGRDDFKAFREEIGEVALSAQINIGFVPRNRCPEEFSARARSRYGSSLQMIGRPDEILAYLAALHDHGVRRVYIFFSEEVDEDLMGEFGEKVIQQLHPDGMRRRSATAPA